MTAPSAEAAATKPFDFIVTFWGEAFRGHFLRLCLPSMLSPGNIPALAPNRPVRFLIATTPVDWAAMQDHPAFRRLRSHAEPIFLELRFEPPKYLHAAIRQMRGRLPLVPDGGGLSVTPDDILSTSGFKDLTDAASALGQPVDRYSLAIFAMSQGHKSAAQLSHAAKGYGVFLAPDMVLSDGAVAALQRHAAAGMRVVFAAANRFTFECAEELLKKFQSEDGAVLTLPPRELVETAFRHLHPETAHFEWESPTFADVPTSTFWRVPGDAGCVMHSFFWAPLLVDYGSVAAHDADYLDSGGTTDGRYIALHFAPDDGIHIVTDSDEICLASFTDPDDTGYPAATHWYKSWAPVAERFKILNLSLTLGGPMGDDLKSRYYPVPVRFHSADLTAAWDVVEARAWSIVSRALSPRRPLERLLLPLVRATRPDRANLPSLLSRPRAGLRRIRPLLTVGFLHRTMRRIFNRDNARDHGDK